MRLPRIVPAAVLSSAVSLAGVVPTASSRPVPPQPPTEIVYYDAADPSGGLSGGFVVLPRPALDRAALRPPPGTVAVTLLDNGNPLNRVDLVTVGDGYQAAQLGAYAAHAQNAVNQLLNQEPFKTYASVFAVHRVDVVSIDSGVDNDPVPGIARNTALDMGFWCNNIERLLCVNVTKAYQRAAAAPQPFDQILAIANSTKYGGAGYTTSELATLSGANGLSPEVAIHELGHSFGNLADEYEYGGPATWTGGEPSAPNVSIRTAAQMAQLATKWHLWLGDNNPLFDGLVSTYEGANYSLYGIYRPTFNSKMRSLNRPFNLPSVESLIVEIYREVRPIDDSTPTSEVLSSASIPFIDPIDPLNNPLAIQWSLNGAPILGATSPTLSIAALGLAPGLYSVSVRVVDNTPWVRNATLRNQWLTQTRSWGLIVAPPSCYPDCTGEGQLNVNDHICFQSRFALGDPYADCDQNGVRDVNDYICFQTRFALGC